MTLSGRIRYSCVLACVLALAMLASTPAYAQTNPVDCEGPAGDPEPGTVEWLTRDANNIFCATQRHLDQLQHPVSLLPTMGSAEDLTGLLESLVTDSEESLAPAPLLDAYREPARHDGVRFRFEATTITNRSGEALATEIYRPCAAGTCDGLPAALQTFEPPYPAIVVLHGGGSRKELHWWSSQTLAEAGYITVAFDGAATNRTNAEDVLDWLLATPQMPTAAGEHNPFWDELDRERIGLAGHSRGGQMASVLGQDDSRVTAIVSWDRGTNLPLPEALDTPTLFFVGDYDCQANPVCQPEPYLEPPQGEGPGERGQEYEIVHAAGVDAMKISLRASTHLDWTPSEASGNRYAEIVSVYYTLAWFDRYLKGADDPATASEAFARLTAPVFDDSADIHNISQGLYDPLAALTAGDLFAGNVPYRIEGMPVADRLSFYFESKCDIGVPDTSLRAESDDIRSTGCEVTPASATSNDGSGGGGCTLSANNRDAGLLVLLLVALAAGRFRIMLSTWPRASSGQG